MRFILDTKKMLHTKGHFLTVGSKRQDLRIKNTEGPLLPIHETYPTNLTPTPLTFTKNLYPKIPLSLSNLH